MSDTNSRRFSLGGFAVALVTVAVGAAAGLQLGSVSGSSYLGMFLGGFLAGLAVEDRPLLEAGVAAALASLGILVAGGVVGNGIVAAAAALGSIAPTTLLASIGISFAVGAFGAHFGDDLRDGLTAPVEEPARARRSARGASAGANPSASRSDDAVAHEPAEDREPADGNETERDTGVTESRDDVELDRN